MAVIGWRVSPENDLSRCLEQGKAGRWHYAGCRLLYVSSTPELAVLEARAHHRRGVSGYWLQQVSTAEPLSLQRVDPESLPADWNRRPPVTREIGTKWLREERSAGLMVPSSLCPEATNLLVNPTLVTDLELRPLRPFRFDRRLVLAL